MTVWEGSVIGGAVPTCQALLPHALTSPAARPGAGKCGDAGVWVSDWRLWPVRGVQTPCPLPRLAVLESQVVQQNHQESPTHSN